MPINIKRFLCLLVLSATALAGRAADGDQAKQAWQLLDYVAVDYEGAVSNRKVVGEDEYKEMAEFSLNVERLVRSLPETNAMSDLVRRAGELRRLVQSKAPPEEVSAQARQAALILYDAYPMNLAPKRTPSIQLGEEIYRRQCASCHGADGKGDGPLSARLEPKPADFTAAERRSQRSFLSYYQAVTHVRGVVSAAACRIRRGCGPAAHWSRLAAQLVS